MIPGPGTSRCPPTKKSESCPGYTVCDIDRWPPWPETISEVPHSLAPRGCSTCVASLAIPRAPHSNVLRVTHSPRGPFCACPPSFHLPPLRCPLVVSSLAKLPHGPHRALTVPPSGSFQPEGSPRVVDIRTKSTVGVLMRFSNKQLVSMRTQVQSWPRSVG